MPTQTEEKTHSNLVTTEGEIPLRGVMIEGHVAGTHAKITVKQRYENTEKKSLEAVYTFPLQENSAVCEFSAKVGDKVIKGIVDEKERAFETYDDAISAGNGAFLLDQERPNIFTASIGNLKPGTEVEVSITYISPLTFEDKALRVMIPTTISPRFVPYDPVEVGQPDAEKINPPSQNTVPYGFGLNLTVEMGSEITKIVSPSHKISAEKEKNTAILSLEEKNAAMDRDLVILIESKDPHKPYSLVGMEEEGTRVAMVTLYPDPKEIKDLGREVLFVLDCSGSMQGDSIEEAKRVLGLCIRGLSEKDGFNIIRFGSRHESLWENPRAFTSETLSEASSWLERMSADLGGTNIYPPMLKAVSGPYNEEKPRQVLLFTDGQVSNEDDIIALCKGNAQTVRVFAFGLGFGCSEYFIKGIARAGKGAAEFIFPGERIEPKVLRTFRRISTPVFPTLKIDWKGMRIDQAPLETPPIFAGEAFTVFAKIQYGTADTISLKAGDQEWSVPFNPEISGENNKFIPVLWAKHRIQDLEDGRRAKYGSQQADRINKVKEKNLTELGIKYGLLTSMTSFVAVEEREEKDKSTEELQLRRVPIAITKGWHGQGSVIQNSAQRLSQGAELLSNNRERSCGGMLFDSSVITRGLTKSSVRKRARSSEWSRGGERFSSLEAQSLDFEGTRDFEVSEVSEISNHIKTEDDRTKLYKVLLTQMADGSFPWTNDLELLLGEELILQLRKEADKFGALTVATLAVIVFLKKKMMDYKDEWDLAALKATKWLRGIPDTHMVHIEI